MWKTLSITALVLGMGSAKVSRAAEPAFRGDIEAMAEQNTDFRHVVFTGPNIQLVAMDLRPHEDIGEEVHPVDQCFFFVEGTAQVILNGRSTPARENGAVCVPAGTRHNIRNSGNAELKLYTTYAPPQHPAGTVHHTKADAQRAEAAHSEHPGK